MACGTGKTLTALWIAEGLHGCGRSPDRAIAAGPQGSLGLSSMPNANAKSEEEICGRSPVRGRETRAQRSSLTQVLVPSLSLVQQSLAEWGRHSMQDFDTLVVCLDESVLQSQADTAIPSTADLGVQVTTKPVEIRHFLGQQRQRPAAVFVFAMYQSSDRIAAAQAGSVADWVAGPESTV